MLIIAPWRWVIYIILTTTEVITAWCICCCFSIQVINRKELQIDIYDTIENMSKFTLVHSILFNVFCRINWTYLGLGSYLLKWYIEWLEEQIDAETVINYKYIYIYIYIYDICLTSNICSEYIHIKILFQFHHLQL